MIIVTGATGQLGSQVVEALLTRVPADQVGVSVRDTGEAAELAARDVRVRRGDFTDPDTLATAFENATQVLVISAGIRGEDRAVAAHRSAIDAARAAGAQRIVYTSHQAAAADSRFSPARGHAATQRYLADAGVPFTALRNGFYATTVPRLIGPALETGTIAAPADGPVSWTGHGDLAEAAAAVLADPGRLDGISPPLTATETLDLTDIAALLSEITGRRIDRVVVEDEQWLHDQVDAGVPEAAAEFTLGLYRAARHGEFAVTDPTLTDLIARPTTPLRTLLQDHVARS